MEARVFTTVLAAAQTLYDKYGRAADPWMTLVGYFNALRELGGARRIVDDDVSNRLRRTDRKGLARRRRPLLRELTSRIGSGDIPEILDQLGVPHDPDAPKSGARPIDVLLATNMISVGVDVPRLGLLVAVGQPKATAEYIQATSRVGRSVQGPGLVITIYNWARPRDLSHYEAFEQYHATFYRHVEALSVTPFAARALDRGLTGLLVALTRQQRLAWNPNRAAQAVSVTDPLFTAITNGLASRAEEISGDPQRGALVREMVQTRLDELQVQRGGQVPRWRGGASAIPLLCEPSAEEWTRWTCPTSMREVKPNVNWILDRRDPSLEGAPPYEPAARTDGQGELTLELIDRASRELIIVSYAAYKVPALVSALEQARARGVTVRLVLESTADSAGALTHDGAAAFVALRDLVEMYVWPIEKRPTGARLHAKVAVADGELAFVTSANLTGHALDQNLEIGMLVHGGLTPRRLAEHFQTLIAKGTLRRFPS